MPYSGRRVLVTGGLGFLGSNLTLALLERGAEVTVIDSLEPGCGGNLGNLGPVLSNVRLLQQNIARAEEFPDALQRAEVVFNLAGEISHLNSMRNPLRDFQLNAEAQLRFLLALARHNPGVRVVHASTRQVYGRPKSLPVKETHPVEMVDFNGIHKFAASQYHAILTKQGKLDAIALRLTNAYGPRLALDVPGQGFLGVFFRLAAAGQAISVYGDGSQLRDPIYVSDVVDAFLLAGTCTEPPSRVYNVGGPEALDLQAIASIISLAAGRGSTVHCVPFPKDQAQVDIGSYVSDCSRIRRELGWAARITLSEGAGFTLDHIRASSQPAQPAHKEPTGQG